MNGFLTNGNSVEYPEMLSVSSSPHLHRGETTASIMCDVLIALALPSFWGIYKFGLRALIIMLVCVGSSIFFEWGFEKITHRKNSITDLSAAVTGLMLALNLPVTIPYYMAVLGSFFAIVVVKQVFGGIGKNVFNPALAARVFLCLSFPTAMTTFTRVGKRLFFLASEADVDAVSSATPLSFLKQGAVCEQSVFDLFVGNCSGTIGEISSFLIIIGAAYLMMRKVINWRIPTAYLGTVALLAVIFPRVAGAGVITNVMLELCSGGLLFAAFFMATDYATSPLTKNGKLIFGVGCGLITVFIRRFGGYAEGASFSILIMNSLVYFIDKYTMPRRFGTPSKKAKSKEPTPAKQ